ncbi:DUF2742 domain-containing protein [Mycobacterium persicum]|uniref:DUF2742 domain-containing protein n=1 Tax=Mycobacterium persicum TaxID=1487726 RepID=UPI00159406C8|nr:DUF2742 domain-containing protein [Mycobacterium persicum]
MSPPERESRPGGNRTADPLAADGSIVTARQTCWLAVHDLVAPILGGIGYWPLLGSPEWCSLPDADARKWGAVIDGGQHHALRLELNQLALAEASRAVSAAADWGALASDIRNRRDAYIPRQGVS